MSKKTNGVKKAKMTIPVKNRRRRVILTLEQQLAAGFKTKKKSFDEKLPLTEKDVNRIQNEIKTLKSRI